MVCKLYICDIGAIQTKVNDHCLDIAAALNDEQCLTLHLTTGVSEYLKNLFWQKFSMKLMSPSMNASI